MASQEHAMLLKLGIGYLYLAQKEYVKSIQVVMHANFENFFLDDFRLHFMALAFLGIH